MVDAGSGGTGDAQCTSELSAQTSSRTYYLRLQLPRSFLYMYLISWDRVSCCREARNSNDGRDGFRGSEYNSTVALPRASITRGPYAPTKTMLLAGPTPNPKPETRKCRGWVGLYGLFRPLICGRSPLDHRTIDAFIDPITLRKNRCLRPSDKACTRLSNSRW